jgi:hypothetical protein
MAKRRVIPKIAGKQESPNNLTHLASAQPCEVKKRKILNKLQH